MPSAPGYVPKYESKDRFSCITTTTCLIFWRAASRTEVPPNGVGIAVSAGVGRRSPDAAGEGTGLSVEHAATSSVATTVARTRSIGRRGGTAANLAPQD